MLIACWSVKGGSGTTVVSVALALVVARRTGSSVAVADLAGDVPAVLGLAEGDHALGIHDWLRAGRDVPASALDDLSVALDPSLRVLRRGTCEPPFEPLDAERFGVALASIAPVVVDCGTIVSGSLGHHVATTATHSLLVLRPCFLSLRRAVAAPVRPSAVVLVDDGSHTLGAPDVEDALGVAVCARVRWDPRVARAVDAGLLAQSLPRSLARDLASAA